MILVLLGTQKNSFSRLLDELEYCINNNFINEDIIVQAGYTKYISKKMKILDFIPSDEMEHLLSKADLIITHGGVGSILNSLKLHKKIIAVPRLAEYNEHVNNHQKQIVEKFNSEGYIIGINDVLQLPSALKGIKNFLPKEFKSNTNNMIKLISDYINNN